MRMFHYYLLLLRNLLSGIITPGSNWQIPGIPLGYSHGFGSYGSTPPAKIQVHFIGSYPRRVPGGHPPLGSGPLKVVQSYSPNVIGHFFGASAEIVLGVGVVSSTGAQALRFQMPAVSQVGSCYATLRQGQQLPNKSNRD